MRQDDSKSILVIEGDLAILALLSATLEKGGIRTLRARTGAEAMEITSRAYVPFHLAVCNQTFMGEGEDDLGSHLRAVRPGLRILNMSSGTDGPVLRIALATAGGGDGDLISAVHQALNAPKTLSAGQTT